MGRFAQIVRYKCAFPVRFERTRGNGQRRTTDWGSMSHDYSTAWDALTEAIGAAKGQSAGSIADQEHLTVDQRLKVAEVAALLSIAQELSALNPQNTTTSDDQGNTVNGWGMVMKKTKPKTGRFTQL